MPKPLELDFHIQGEFFSLKCCLAMYHLMEVEDTNVLNTLHTQNGMCMPGKDLVLSAPSNSCLR